MSHPQLTISGFSNPDASSSGRVLVMLCGVGIQPGDFETQGFVARLHKADPGLDLWAVAPSTELYLDNKVGALLQTHFLNRFRGKRLSLLGISLGGMGALACAAHSSTNLERLILLAPFLGTQGMVTALASCGGFAEWREPPASMTALEIECLSWLRTRLAWTGGPDLYLGHASDDRFKSGHQLLARDLDPDHVIGVTGGHDWDAWRAQLEGMLQGPLQSGLFPAET